jgi:hypothetical protein
VSRKVSGGDGSLATKLVPDENQEAFINEMLMAADFGGAILAEGLGRGKTLTVTEVIIRSNAQCVLLVVPLGTRVGWERHLTLQGFKHPIYRIEAGTNYSVELDKLRRGEPGAYMIGTQFFKNPKFDWTKFKKIHIAVVDESHKFSNRQSKGFSRLLKLKPGFRISISGTPWGNRIENMWAGTRWVYPDYAGGSFWRWAEEYLTQRINTIYRKNPRTGVPEGQEVTEFTGERVPGEYVESLPCFLRTPGEHPEIPPKRYDQLFVELSPKQRRMYDAFERDALIYIKDNPLVATVPLALRTRLRQMTLGTVSVSGDGEVYFEADMQSAKFDVLKEYLQDNDENVIIYVGGSKKYAKIVVERLGAQARLWSGDQTIDERVALIDGFGRDFKYIVAVPEAMGEGWDGLQHNCNTMIWVSRTEDGVVNEQSEGRLARRGQPKDHVLCIDIVAADTYDESIIDRNYLKKKIVDGSLGGLA